MALGWLSLRKINNRVAESAEQDQHARMCRLILLYTLRKVNLWLWTAGWGYDKSKETFPAHCSKPDSVVSNLFISAK